MDKLSFDLNAVRSFIAVVEKGGVRQAAQALAMPRSTVSRRLAELEGALGQTLLKRTTRKIALTDVGRVFYERTLPALLAVSEAAKSVQDGHDAPRGVLKVSASATLAELFLGPVFVEYARRFPDVRVSLDLSDRYVDLVSEGYDVAVRAGPLPDSSLVARSLGATTLLAVAAPTYLKARGIPRTPEDLAEHDCLVGPAERNGAWVFMKRKKKLTVSVKPRLAANSFLLVREFALNGLGIARVPERLVAGDLHKRLLVQVLEDFQPPPAPLSVVFSPSPHLAPRIRAFVDLLVGAVSVSKLKLPGERLVPARGA